MHFIDFLLTKQIHKLKFEISEEILQLWALLFKVV